MRLASRPLGRYPALVALILGGFAVLLIWDVVHYPSAQGIDSRMHFRYVETIQEHFRPPTREEVPIGWHNPPLFHIAAAAIESSWTAADRGADGVKRARKLVQLFNVALALGIAALVFLLARELFPRSRTAQVAALAATVLAPPLTRTTVMYHGQTLATLLSTAALFVVVRALVRHQVTVKTGLLAGLLLALGVLTRQFVVATAIALGLSLVVYFLYTRERAALKMALAMTLATVALSAPWFVHQQVRYGSPVAQTLEAPDVPLLNRQPPEFYLGRPIGTVLTEPYRPAHTNRLPQTLYTDWWGDYFLYFEVPRSLRKSSAPARRARQDRLPAPYHAHLVRQSYVGLLPTLLMILGLAGLFVSGLRRRAAALIAIPLTFALIAFQAITFIVGYPVPDGDTMKALYVLTAVPPLALALGWSVMWLRARSEWVFRLVVGVLLAAALLNLQFLWLDGSVS